MATQTQLIETSRGPARATAHLPADEPGPFLVVALHGAGTDTARTPLPELCDALAERGIVAVRFDQPYRVAGRKAPDPAHLVDRALVEAAPQLKAFAPEGAALGLVGRSSGARVACRTAAELGAVAVACLGFPYQPPARKGGPLPADRGPELALAARRCPVLVVQGSRDQFGMPPEIAGVRLIVEPAAGHTPTLAMAEHAAGWLSGVAREHKVGRAAFQQP